MTSASDKPVRIALIVNSAAGHGRSAQVGQRGEEVFRKGGADVTVYWPDSAADSLRALQQAVAQQPQAVIVCGGDGIVHLAVNMLAGGDIPLGIVPAGSGNDAALSLGFAPDPAAAAKELLNAARAQSMTRIDVGRCDGPELVPGTPRAFVGLLYTGIDSAVNDLANRLRWPRGAARYNIALAIEALRLRPRLYRITFDEHCSQLRAVLIAVGNNSRYGGGKIIAPHARWDDGRLGVTVIGPVSLLTLARLAPTLPRAGHTGHRLAYFRDANEVSLVGVPGSMAYADGERVGPLPIRVWTDPAALPVLVPPSVSVP